MKTLLQVSKIIYALDEEVAYQSGSVLESVNVKRKGDGWLLVVKVTSPKGAKLVGFMNANTYTGAWELLTEALTTTNIALKWYPDRFAS